MTLTKREDIRKYLEFIILNDGKEFNDFIDIIYTFRHYGFKYSDIARRTNTSVDFVTKCYKHYQYTYCKKRVM